MYVVGLFCVLNATSGAGLFIGLFCLCSSLCAASGSGLLCVYVWIGAVIVIGLFCLFVGLFCLYVWIGVVHVCMSSHVRLLQVSFTSVIGLIYARIRASPLQLCNSSVATPLLFLDQVSCTSALGLSCAKRTHSIVGEHIL